MLAVFYVVLVLSHFEDGFFSRAEVLECTDDYSKIPICVESEDYDVFCENPSLSNNTSSNGSRWASQEACGKDQFRCLRHPYDCISNIAQCDGTMDCKDGSDEIELCSSSQFIQCSTYRSTTWLRWTFENNQISQHCQYDDTVYDVALLQGFKCVIDSPTPDLFTLKRVVIPQFRLLQDQPICVDQSDQCFDPSGHFRCSRCLRDGAIISKSQVCDGLFDCADLSDECACPSPINVTFCNDVINGDVDTSLVCDGKVDFDDCLDELYCGVDRLKELPMRCCPKLLENQANLPKQYVNFNLRYCAFSIRPSADKPYCHGNKLGDMGARVFSPRKLNSIPIPDMYQSTNCTSNKMQRRIQKSQICDLEVDCDDKSDEMNCSAATHFYCGGIDPKEFISRRKVGDGVVDCKDFSDECADGHTNLIDSRFLGAFIWLVCIVTIAANLTVLWNLYHLKQSRHTCKGCIQFVNSILITNLTISDLLMGVSLLIICVKSIQFNQLYCAYRITWKASFFCDLIGCLVVISSQSSLNCLSLLSAYRLYVTVKPFTANQINFKLCYVLVFISWAIAAAFAFTPVFLSHKLTTQTYIVRPNPYLPNRMYTAAELIAYNDKSTKLLRLVPTKYHLYVTSEEFQASHPDRYVEIEGSLSYYSGLSICFPMFYINGLDGSSKGIITLAIVCYNSVSLLFIGVSYLAIYVNSTTKSTVSTDPKRKEENSVLRKRIFSVILTDICSWLPIISISILLYFGAQVDNTVLEYVIITLLPINSALNPIIYSRIDRVLFHKLRKLILFLRAR